MDLHAAKELLIRARNTSLIDVLPRIGVQVRRGRRFDCPSCGHTGRSCGALRDGLRWKCFACAGGGTLVDFAMARCGETSVGERVFAELEAIIEPEYLVEPVRRIQRVEKPGLTPEQVASWWKLAHHADGMGWHRGGGAIMTWMARVRGIETYPDCPGAFHHSSVPSERLDIRASVDAGPCAVFPLYSTHPERVGQLRNMLVRPINPVVVAAGESKPWKARLLNWGPGTADDAGWPIAYGQVDRLMHTPALVVLCEGALDTYTMIAACDALRLPVAVVGSYSEGNMARIWAQVVARVPASWIVIPHLDPVRNGRSIGVESSRKLAKNSPARLWPWKRTLDACGWTFETFQASGRTDINDLIRRDLPDGREVGWSLFLGAIERVLKGEA